MIFFIHRKFSTNDHRFLTHVAAPCILFIFASCNTFEKDGNDNKTVGTDKNAESDDIYALDTDTALSTDSVPYSASDTDKDVDTDTLNSEDSSLHADSDKSTVPYAGDNWEWEEVTSISSCNTTDAISFPNKTKGWVAGSNGCIVHTNDGGTTWESQISGTTNSLRDIVFVNENSGWAVGKQNTVLHTKDGGVNWSLQTVPTEQADRDFLTLFFVDQNNGWIGGNHPAIFYTMDGGGTWEQGEIDTRWTITGIYFTDTQNGYAVGTNRVVLRTTDSGKHWTTTDLEKLDYRGGTVIYDSIEFSDSKTGWIGLNDASALSTYKLPLLHTDDGGDFWKLDTLPFVFEDHSRFVFTDKNTGWLFNYRHIYATDDGGTSWQTTFVSEDYLLVDLSAPNPFTAFAIDSTGIVVRGTR